jgi:serine/threonine protein kinase
MDTDLSCVLKSKQPMSENKIRLIFYQIIRGLKFVHSAGIIHRDIKPRNILINSNCDVQICDFGLSRKTCTENEFKTDASLTDYVCTRWYRAPEILCEFGTYTTAIDVWSAGCVLGELLEGEAIFKGDTTDRQIEFILKRIGTESVNIQEITNRIIVSNLIRIIENINNFNNTFKIPIISKLLKFSPKLRPTCSDILNDEYFIGLHDPEDEPTHKDPRGDFSFDYRSLDKEIIAELIHQEAVRIRQGDEGVQEYLSVNPDRRKVEEYPEIFRNTS